MKFGLVGWGSASLASRIVPAGWFVGLLVRFGFLPKAPRPGSKAQNWHGWFFQAGNISKIWEQFGTNIMLIGSMGLVYLPI